MREVDRLATAALRLAATDQRRLVEREHVTRALDEAA